jgi:hypothetical protein
MVSLEVLARDLSGRRSAGVAGDLHQSAGDQSGSQGGLPTQGPLGVLARAACGETIERYIDYERK